MEKLFKISWRFAMAGLVFVTFLIGVTILSDGDRSNGVTTNIDRNPRFFGHAPILEMPQYFTKVYIIEFCGEDYYGVLNLLAGMAAGLLLLFSYSLFDRGGVLKIFAIVYVAYWSYVTLYIIFQYLTGNFLVY